MIDALSKKINQSEVEIFLTFNKLYKKVESYTAKNKEDLKLLEKANEFIEKYHKNQIRKSGDLYIRHLIEVGGILADFKSPAILVTIGLLHDIIEDTEITKKILEKEFGGKIANAVNLLSKVKKINVENKTDINYLYIQQLIIGMLGDEGVIIVKLADRLHNMRTLSSLDKEKRRRIAKETMEVFVPITHKLAIHNFKFELEDLCFYHLDPKNYYRTKELLNDEKLRTIKTLTKLEKNIENYLNKKNFDYVNIYGRRKHIYSVFKKMDRENKKLSEILDLLAIRIITKNKGDCYKALELIHEKFRPIPAKLKDFISLPKQNLYKALHTTVIQDEITFEVQIRDEQMEEVANWGIASHYNYKKGKNNKEAIEFFQYIKKYSDQYKLNSDTQEELVKDAMNDLFGQEIPIITPKGDIIQIKKGSTVLDFAFKLHTELAEKSSYAFVNGKRENLAKKLNSGDIVSVQTNEINELTFDHLLWVNEQFSKKYIRKKLRENSKINVNFEENYAKQIIKDFLKFNKEFSVILESEKNLKIIMKRLGIKTLNELYKKIISKDVEIITMLNSYFKIKRVNNNLEKFKKEKLYKKAISKKREKNLSIENSDLEIDLKNRKNIKIKLCDKCYPIYGDNVIAKSNKNIFKSSENDEIVIHRNTCDLAKNIKANNKIAVDWKKSQKNKKKYWTKLELTTENRIGILKEILEEFSLKGISLYNLNSKVAIDGKNVKIQIIFEIENIDVFSKLFVQLKSNNYLIKDIVRK